MDLDEMMKMQGGMPGSSEAAPPPPASGAPPAPTAPVQETPEIQAEKLKSKGNEYYKVKDYPNSLKCYDEAIKLSPKEPIFHLNKASVYLETKQFDACLSECDSALEICQSLTPRPFDKIAKSYARKGNCYMQMSKIQEAISMYDKSLLEANDSHVKEAKKKAEALLKKQQDDAYIDPAKSEEAKDKGNGYYRDGNYGEALKCYEEAIKRNPKNPVVYFDRALTYMKMLEHPKALADLVKTLELDPKYVKAWAKKGDLHFFGKEYHKALEAYQKGLDIDPASAECAEGRQKTQLAVYQGGRDEERVKKAMADPEIQLILQDPRIQQVLKEAKEGQNTINDALKDPWIAQAINKLMAAGIIG